MSRLRPLQVVSAASLALVKCVPTKLFSPPIALFAHCLPGNSAPRGVTAPQPLYGSDDHRCSYQPRERRHPLLLVSRSGISLRKRWQKTSHTVTPKGVSLICGKFCVCCYPFLRRDFPSERIYRLYDIPKIFSLNDNYPTPPKPMKDEIGLKPGEVIFSHRRLFEGES